MDRQWSRGELEEAFAAYQAAVTECVATGDWEPFVQRFTPDATVVEHVYGDFTGHDAIRAWVTRTMGSFPGNEMVAFPANWVVVDEERGWVLCEIANPMRDPGDGSVHGATNLTILRYGGDGLWREEEDVYNPAHFMTATTDWLRRCHELGTLAAEHRGWAEKMGLSLT